MIKRKIASDAPHVQRLKEIMINRINQINIYPEFLRPTAIETQIDDFRRVIGELDPNEPGYNQLRSKYYSEWSDDEIEDYRNNFLAREAIPRLEAMAGGTVNPLYYSDPRFNEDVEIIANNLVLMAADSGAGDLRDAIDIVVNSLYDGDYNNPHIYKIIEMFLLKITRRRNLRYRVFLMMLELFTYIAGEGTELGLQNYFAKMERELNDEGRSFFRENKKKLSSKSFNGLISLSNHLDARGYSKEANQLDLIIRKLARKES